MYENGQRSPTGSAGVRDVAEALAVVEDIEAGLAESDAGLGVDTDTLRRQFGLMK